jgi:hypothetical protein
MNLRPREPIDMTAQVSVHPADIDLHLKKWLFRMRR